MELNRKEKYRLTEKGKKTERLYRMKTRHKQKSSTARWLSKLGSREKLALAKRRANFRSKYGLYLDDYDSMLSAQNGACRACLGVNGSGKRLAVDHDHDNMRVRGLLCEKCNLALGLLDEDPKRMLRLIEYIRMATSL